MGDSHSTIKITNRLTQNPIEILVKHSGQNKHRAQNALNVCKFSQNGTAKEVQILLIKRKTKKLEIRNGSSFC